MSSQASKHDDILDFFRGVAALLVVAGHIRALIFEAWAGGGLVAQGFYFLTALGHQAVIVFFVLSGYLVGGSVIFSVSNETWSFRRYILRRYVRLSIVLVPALGLTFLLDHLGLNVSLASGLYSGWAGNSLINFSVSDRLTVGVLVGNILFLQSILVETFGSNGALWSLAYEFWFYILFPVLVVPALGRNWWLLLLSTVLLIGFISLTGLESLGYFCIWSFGALVAYCRKVAVLHEFSAGAFPLLASGLILAFSLGLSVKGTSSIWVEYFVALAFSAFLLFAVGRDAGSTFLRFYASFFAKISFSLYATHLPLAVLMAALILHGERMAFGLAPIAIFCAIVLVVIVFAFVVWWIFERNTQRIQSYLEAKLL